MLDKACKKRRALTLSSMLDKACKKRRALTLRASGSCLAKALRPIPNPCTTLASLSSRSSSRVGACQGMLWQLLLPAVLTMAQVWAKKSWQRQIGGNYGGRYWQRAFQMQQHQQPMTCRSSLSKCSAARTALDFEAVKGHVNRGGGGMGGCDSEKPHSQPRRCSAGTKFLQRCGRHVGTQAAHSAYQYYV